MRRNPGGFSGKSPRLPVRNAAQQPNAWYVPVSVLREESPKTQGGISQNSRRARLEAVLWIANEPLSLRRIAKLAGLSGPAEARDLVAELEAVYRARGAAFGIVSVGGGNQLMTLPKYAPWLGKKGRKSGKSHSLSGPALETLSIVAHKQPIVRAEVEAIRGVSCGELLRQLLEADLLRILGRSEELGRPLLYGTTKNFLQLFGLRSLEDLAPLGEETTGSEPTTSNATHDSSEAA